MRHHQTISKLILAQMIRLILIGLLLVATKCSITQQRATARQQPQHPKLTQANCVEDCIRPFSDALLPIADRLEGRPQFDWLERISQIPADNGKGERFTPSKVQQIKAKFDLYTRRGQVAQLEFEQKKRPVDQLGIDLCDMYRDYPLNFTRMSEAQFDANKRTVIVIPGYITLDEIDWFPRELAKLWLDMEDLNIIAVTWRSANQGAYENAIANIPFVAREVVILLHYLAEASGTNLNDETFLDRIHLIGHSCGSHIAGYVGKDLGGLVGRISGFDPAGPHFEDFESEHRLDRADAKLVDVYHSNMGKLDKKTLFCSMMLDKINGKNWMCPAPNLGVDADPTQPGAWLGIDKPLGHVDIYLNNGHKQPGCKDRAHLCDHGRSSELLYDFLVNSAELNGLQPRQRPLAFHANDYHSFRSGDNFQQDDQCAWLMNDLGDDRVSGALDTCSIPVDFLVSPREYRHELEQQHGIELENPSGSSRSFYLSTSTDQPLLPLHHFMLKLKIASQTDNNNKTRWNDQCRLNVQGSFSSGSEISIPKVQVELGTTNLIALAFNHPRGLDITIHNELKTMLQFAGKSEWLAINKDYLRGKLFPALALSSSVADNTLQAQLPGPTNFKASEDSCQLEIEYASIEPVWTNPKTFYGLFSKGNQNSSIDSMDSQQFQDQDRWPRLVINANSVDLGLKTIILDD